MNDDDLLFGMDDLERYKRGEQPEDWFAKRGNELIARYRAQAQRVARLRQVSSPAELARLDHNL